MPVEQVAVSALSAAAPHFSLAVTAPGHSRLLFISGLSARTEGGSVVGLGDAAAQTEEIYHKLELVLAAAGGTLQDLVRLDVFVRHAHDQPIIAGVRKARHQDGVPPTSTMVVVSGFPDERYLLEISAIAALSAESGPQTGPGLLRLSAQDDVATATRALEEGERVVLDDQVALVVGSAVPFGHKVALRDMAQGQDILKYGQPIGHATSDIAAGDHVHTHNLVGNRLSVEEA